MATPLAGCVVITGNVTFVKSAGVPSGFLSLVRTGIFTVVFCAVVVLSGLATGGFVPTGLILIVTSAVSQTVGISLSQIL